MAMLEEIIGIRHPIPLDVWPIRVLWIGPPVITLREKIMRSARAAIRVRGSDCDGFLVQILRRLLHDPRSLDFTQIEKIPFWILRRVNGKLSGQKPTDDPRENRGSSSTTHLWVYTLQNSLTQRPIVDCPDRILLHRLAAIACKPAKRTPPCRVTTDQWPSRIPRPRGRSRFGRC